MHTVELRELALALARRLGYQIREEWLGECGGGACEFGGRKWLFLDLSLSTLEQLEQLLAALRADPQLATVRIPRPLLPLLRDALGDRSAPDATGQPGMKPSSAIG